MSETSEATTAERLWLLTIDYGWDDECDDYMWVRQSLHRNHERAMLRVFDVVHEITGATPQDAIVVASSNREDGATFVDLNAAGAAMTYSLVPLTIEGDC